MAVDPPGDPGRRSAFEAALNNEYFVLQSARGSTIAESGNRASLYIVSLSISLVAIGFVGPSSPALGPFLATVLPTLFVLGLFTVVRLVDTGTENLRCIRAMAAIQAYYATLTPDAPGYFGTGARRDPGPEYPSARRGRLAGLSTTASMIATVNAVVGGAGVALFLAWVQGGISRGYAMPVAAGGVCGVALLFLFFAYQARQYAALP